MDASAQALQAAGAPVSSSPGWTADGYSFTALDPDGLSLCFAAAPAQEAATGPDDKPLYISHVVINRPQSERMLAFHCGVLGFTVSDSFLRCDQPQHHCIGISPAQASGLNHFAMDCGGIDALWQPHEWARTPENGNTWLTGGPSPRAIELMSGQGPA